MIHAKLNATAKILLCHWINYIFYEARHHRIKANNGQIHQPKAIITTLQAKADLAGKTNLSDGLTKQKCVLHHVYAAGKLANMQRLVSPNPDWTPGHPNMAANTSHKPSTQTLELASQIATAEKNISVQRLSEQQIATALKSH